MPLVMSKDEWSRIVSWTDSNRENPETVRRREYIRYLHETSQAMTKAWPNSLENVNKRNEELRRARIAAAEQANTDFYKQYVRRRREEQRRLMAGARDIIFKNKDAPKMLLRAVIESVTQKEREEQVKFLGELRRQAAQRKRDDDAEITRNAEEWNRLMATRKQRRFEVNKKYQREILDQAAEVAERRRREHETELRQQQQDNIKANEEMDTIKQFEDDFKEREKARIFRDMEQARREVEARRSECAARDRLDDRLIQVLQNTRARVDRRRKQTEKGIQEEKQRVLHAISMQLATGDAAREQHEREILNKAIKEQQLKEEARHESEVQKRGRMRAEREQLHLQQLRDEEERLHRLHTTRSWEMLNRFKNVELYEDYVSKLREEKHRKTQEHRADLLRLWKEREERDAAEVAARREFYGARAERLLREEERRLLEHAAALVQEARQQHRPEYPLHRAVHNYCKQQRLYSMPPLPRPLQLHFPKYAPEDRSGQAAPLDEAPPSTVAPPTTDTGKRDGLVQGVCLNSPF
ncbi:trichohyalin [Papilio machaon]|uniref:trichohyalin n=1 Tax=Papilio machaon TaxID=76193 RepID=UPI001E662BE0|nr:trichohyalin [Papilio machaon]